MLDATSTCLHCWYHFLYFCTTVSSRGWFLAIGYQIPFEGECLHQMCISTSGTGNENFRALSPLEFNCHTIIKF